MKKREDKLATVKRSNMPSPANLLKKNRIKLDKRLLQSQILAASKFSKSQLILFIAIFAVGGSYFLLRSFAASPPNIYIAQSQAGTTDGSSCANAKAVSFFNTAGNWGTGSTQIGPGTTVHLCGTITSTLTAQGDGASGNPINILFEPSAKLSQPAGNLLTISNRNYITVDGGTNGIVENTANGTGLANQSNATAIFADPCSNCEIKNLTIQNIYIHTGTGTEIDQTQVRAIYFSGSNITVDHNTIHDMGWAVFNNSRSGDTNIHVDHNNIYNVDHNFIQSGGSIGTIFFNDNHVHDDANWDNTSNNYHHDGIHCYTVNGGIGKHIDDFYVYNNTFDGNVGGNATSWIFMEGGTGTGATPCADASSRFWFFNNFGTYASSPGATGFNGVFEGGPGINHWYNNTEVGVSLASGSRVCPDVGGTAWRNNVCSTGDQVVAGEGTGWDAGSPNNNIYANGGGNAFVCTDGSGTHFWGFGNFNLWKGCVGGAGDANSSAPASAGLSTAGVPQAGSVVIGAGANLSSLCTGNLVPLCSDINGNPRPATTAWDAGAFEVTPAANVWVSTAGNDSTCVRGDQTKPCLSLDKAFAVAQCADTVTVAAGSYGDQTISTAKACSSSTQVKFVPAVGAQPVFNNVTIQTSYVWIEGMKVPHSLTGTIVGNWTIAAPSPQLPSVVSYVTLKNDEGGGMYIYAEHVDVLGGSYGGFSACLTGQEDLTRIWQQSDSGGTYHASSYVTFDGVTIHDGTDNGNLCGSVSGPHVDAMQILGGHFITIRKSFFYGCPTSCIIGSGFRTGEDNYLIENNFFQEEANPGATLNFGYVSNGDPATGANMVIRYNTTNGTIAAGCVAGSSGCWDVYGNILNHASYCGGFLSTWEYNVVADNSCGTANGNKIGSPSLIGPTPQSSYGSATIPNFHLSSNDTVALRAGDPARFPGFDYDGDSRPQSTTPNAGADEFAGGVSDSTPPTVSFTAPADSATVSGSSVLVSANASDNVAVTGVQFYLDYAGNPASNKLGAEDTAAPYSFTWNTTTLGNGSHTLTAIARDAAGNTTTSSTITVTVNNIAAPPPDTTPPSTPTGLTSTSTTTSSINLAWNASTDNSGGSGLNGYKLYRNGSYLTTIIGLINYTDNGLSASTTYSYQVSAVDNANNESVKSSSVNAMTAATPPGSTPPAKTPGDCNGDGHVTIFDLSILLSHYGAVYSSADFDGNSIVNVIDLSILLSNYGK